MRFLVIASVSFILPWLDLVGRFDKGPFWGLQPESWRICILWLAVIAVDVSVVCLLVPHMVHRTTFRYSTGLAGWFLCALAVLAALRSGFRSGRFPMKEGATESNRKARTESLLKGVGGLYDAIRAPLLGALDIQLAARKARRTRSLALALADRTHFSDCVEELARIVSTARELPRARRVSIEKLIRAARADDRQGDTEAAMSKLIDLAFSLGCTDIIYSRLPSSKPVLDPMLIRPRWLPNLPLRTQR
jgi:hypothetical protein